MNKNLRQYSATSHFFARKLMQFYDLHDLEYARDKYSLVFSKKWNKKHQEGCNAWLREYATREDDYGMRYPYDEIIVEKKDTV